MIETEGNSVVRARQVSKKVSCLARVLGVVSGIIMVVALPLRAHAATQSITVTPVSVDTTIQPGVLAKGSLTVINQGDISFEYSLYASSYTVSNENYDPSFTPIAGATNVSSWFQLSKDPKTLRPGGQDLVDYTISAPANTKPGGYYGVVFAETESKAEGTGVTTRKRVGTVFYLRVAGSAAAVGKVASWKVPFFQQKPLKATLRLENSGTLHYLASVNTQVKDVFGNTKFTFRQSREILPQKLRKIDIVWSKSPTFGLFKVTGNVLFQGVNQDLGEHYVLLASPLMLYILAAAILLLLTMLVWIIIRKRHRGRKKNPTQATL